MELVEDLCFCDCGECEPKFMLGLRFEDCDYLFAFTWADEAELN